MNDLLNEGLFDSGLVLEYAWFIVKLVTFVILCILLFSVSGIQDLFQFIALDIKYWIIAKLARFGSGMGEYVPIPTDPSRCGLPSDVELEVQEHIRALRLAESQEEYVRHFEWFRDHFGGAREFTQYLGGMNDV